MSLLSRYTGTKIPGMKLSLFDRCDRLNFCFPVFSGLSIEHHHDDAGKDQTEDEGQIQIQIKTDFLIEYIDENHIGDKDCWSK